MAVAAGAPAVPVGWAWLSGRTNSLTGARYGNFRSLATADVPGRGQVAELLMQAVLQGVGPGRFRAPHRQGARQATWACARCTGSSGSRRPTSRWKAPALLRTGPGRGARHDGEPVRWSRSRVVWDIDNTLLTGIYLESGDRAARADPVLTAVLAELGERGILHALASRTRPRPPRTRRASPAGGSPRPSAAGAASPTRWPGSQPRWGSRWTRSPSWTTTPYERAEVGCRAARGAGARRRRRPRRPPAGRSSARR